MSEQESDGGMPPTEATPEQTSPQETAPVADALAELDTLAERDLADHPEVFERIHGQLHAALSAVDDA